LAEEQEAIYMENAPEKTCGQRGSKTIGRGRGRGVETPARPRGKKAQERLLNKNGKDVKISEQWDV